jgi:hypothetical protein
MADFGIASERRNSDGSPSTMPGGGRTGKMQSRAGMIQRQ